MRGRQRPNHTRRAAVVIRGTGSLFCTMIADPTRRGRRTFVERELSTMEAHREHRYDGCYDGRLRASRLNPLVRAAAARY
jgi:hypothetical protein